MPLTLLRHATQKPPLGLLQLDPAHPFTKDLVLAAALNEAGSATAFDPVTRQPSLATNIGSWAGTAYGPGMTFNGSSQAIQFNERPEWRPGTSPFTLVVFSNAPSSASAMGLLSKRNNSTFDQMTFAANMNQSGGSNAGTLGAYNAGGGNTLSGAVLSPSLIDGAYHQFVVVRSGTTLTFYRDGVAYTTTYGTQQNSNYAGGEPLHLAANGGTSGPAGSYLNGSIVYAYYWTRALSAAEIASLLAEPYQMFLQRPLQRWFVVAAAPGGGGLPFFMQQELLAGGMQDLGGVRQW